MDYQTTKDRIFEELMLIETPTTNKAFQLAWDWGHSYGDDSIKNYLYDLLELIKIATAPLSN